MSSDTLAQWLQRLEQIHPREIDLGLERIAEVARRMALLPVPQPVVTVAGTNGKGSVVAVLETVLGNAGRRVATFTSPHLQRFNERIRVAGEEATDAEIVAAFAAIEQARGEISLTYFEFAALAALYVFRERAPDVVILEVGLGGRLDAVNIVDPGVAVITSIALDHQEWLGHSRDAIALEKAGILRAGVPVVVADPDPPASLMSAIRSAGAAPALFWGAEFGATVEAGSMRGWVQHCGGERAELDAMACGPLLAENICAALQTAQLLGVDVAEPAMAKALPALVLSAAPAGRRQVVCQGDIEYLLDVAHNPAAVDKLLEYIEVTHCNKRKIAIFSAMADKDVSGMTARAADAFDAWFLADQPANPRAAEAATIASALRDSGQNMVSVSKNLRQALRRAQSIASPGDLLVVFGSFTTVAEAMALLQRDRNKYEAV